MFQAENDVKADSFSLENFYNMGIDHNIRFTVPLYQRLYVWGEEQISRLISDINTARRENRDFYMGGVLLVRKTDKENSLDLIDGQQRFTTLWLLSCYLRRKLTESAKDLPILDHFIGYWPKSKEEPQWFSRLHFVAREEQNDALNNIASRNGTASTDPESYTAPLYTALTLFENYLSDEDLEDFASFLIRNTKLTATTVPSTMDLNKLFEVINNRGVQLQHHEILKAQMLRCVEKADDRGHYAQMWEACADMAGFVDQNLTQATTVTAKDLAQDFYDRYPARSGIANGRAILEKLRAYSKQETQESDYSWNLSEILQESGSRQDAASPSSPKGHDEASDDEDRSWAKAPISFSMLLQHTLRIWLSLNAPYRSPDQSSLELNDIAKVDDKWLVECFSQHFFSSDNKSKNETNVPSFLELLWEVRFILDYYGIKWVEEDEDEYLRVVRATRTLQKQNSSYSNYSINRDRQQDAEKGLSLLQAMLYHSQELVTQYWLTPYLAFIHQEKCSLKGAYAYLRHLDNVLLGRPSQLNDDSRKLINRTRRFLGADQFWSDQISNESQNWDFEQELSPRGGEGSEPGLHCRHYWFYKLDFILLFLDHEDETLIGSINRPGLLDKAETSDFRMTSRNSVEHVTPQKLEEWDPVSQVIHDNNLIDCFGNLGLVSRSINSQYSSHSFKTKKEKFTETQKRQEHCVSPKLVDIFARNWSMDELLDHQDQMLNLMQHYYALDFHAQFKALQPDQPESRD